MAIPKTIYQTFKTKNLPWITQWHIYRLRKKNPDYTYEFYDDARIDHFIESEYGPQVFDLYKQINIGAAKADFFRYAILYKKGGIYLDIDSLAIAKLDSFILPTDQAIISHESHVGIYVQWGLIYAPNHAFLKKTLEIIMDNLTKNAFPHDVHSMTGPTAYSHAIKQCLKENPNIPHRVMGIDYQGKFKFSYRMSKFFLYSGKQHWSKTQMEHPVLKKM